MIIWYLIQRLTDTPPHTAAVLEAHQRYPLNPFGDVIGDGVRGRIEVCVRIVAHGQSPRIWSQSRPGTFAQSAAAAASWA